jgi:hypothetical protein
MNRTRAIPAFSIVPQPTKLPRAPLSKLILCNSHREHRYLILFIYFMYLKFFLWSLDSSVSIPTGYGLDGRRSNSGSVQIGSKIHPVSYPIGTRGDFPGGKAAEARNWPLSSILC